MQILFSFLKKLLVKRSGLSMRKDANTNTGQYSVSNSCQRPYQNCKTKFSLTPWALQIVDTWGFFRLGIYPDFSTERRILLVTVRWKTSLIAPLFLGPGKIWELYASTALRKNRNFPVRQRRQYRPSILWTADSCSSAIIQNVKQ